METPGAAHVQARTRKQRQWNRSSLNLIHHLSGIGRAGHCAVRKMM
jgi:nicotinate-nucleotide pyrophosphorylase